MINVLAAIETGHMQTLVAAWLHLTLSFMVWLLIGALAVPIGEAVGLSDGQRVIAVALPLLSGAFLRIIAGWASDRFGAKRTAMVILLCEWLATVYGSIGLRSFADVLVLGVLLGSGGASFAVTLPLASVAYPTVHRGLAMGLVATGNAGAVLVAFIGPWVSARWGWPAMFTLMTGAVLATLVFFTMVVPSDRQTQRASMNQWGTGVATLLGDPMMARLAFIYAVTFGGFVGLCSVLPMFFHDLYAFDLVAAGGMTALSALVGSLIRPVGGYWADRWGGIRVLEVVCPALAATALGLASLPPVGWALFLLIVGITLMGVGNGAVFQLVGVAMSKQIGLASGLIGAVGALGGFLFPVSLGILGTVSGWYGSGFLLFGSAAAAAGIMVFHMARREYVLHRISH